ncbi:MAG: hypothetical protein C4345_13860, partial [Chloroflexota bacterium]
MNQRLSQRRSHPWRALGSLVVVVLVIAGGLGIAITPAPTMAQTSTFTVGDTVVVTADGDGLNLRAAPGIDTTVLETLPDGTAATISDGPSEAGDLTWYEISVDDRTGWVAGEFLTLAAAIDPGFTAGDQVEVTTDALNLRNAAGLTSEILDTMSLGTTATILDGPVTADGIPWYQVDASGFGEGWVAAGFLTLASETFSVDSVLVVNTDLLNLRAGPSLSDEILAQLPSQALVTVISGPEQADGYDWYEVETDEGNGWVAGTFLANPADLIAVGDTVQVIDGSLRLRAEPGVNADVLDVMPEGTKLEVTDGPELADGYTWFQVENDTYGPGWAAGEFLLVIESGST